MSVHEVVEYLDGEVKSAAGQLQLLRNNARPVHQVPPFQLQTKFFLIYGSLTQLFDGANFFPKKVARCRGGANAMERKF